MLAPLLFAVSPAHADDAKTYPGHLCRSTANSNDAVVAAGGFFNNGYPTLDFECPIVKDEPDSNLDVIDSHVWVTDLSPYGVVHCDLVSRLWIGGYVYESRAVTLGESTSFSSGSPVKLSFFGESWSWTSSTASSINFLDCEVPGVFYGASGITSYLIDENN
jgi:hypothetical protein